jgi:hypothetical protein
MSGFQRHAVVFSVLGAIVFAGQSALAAPPPCRDAHGHFMKCPPPKMIRCRDGRGRFVKCGAPGAHPA